MTLWDEAVDRPARSTTRRLERTIGAVLLGLTLMMVGGVSAGQAREQTYGECTYSCDAIHRRCIREQGKRPGGLAECEAQRRACTARCDALRDQPDKLMKPKR